MSESFRLGEIAIAVNWDMTKYNGQEVEVIDTSGCLLCDGVNRYGVLCGDGKRMCVPGEFLRKRRPPPQREATSSWDDVIVWRPKEPAHV